MSVQSTTTRSLARVIQSVETLEGGGFLVRRPVPTRGVEQLDPFLLIDELGPTQVAPGEAVGAPDHPHKGFEIISYTLAGEGEHRDSHGNHGVLRAGDAQYMIAGSGVVHAEMPTAEFLRTGGLRHGFQIWVNLRAVDKTLPPRYKDVPAASIPVVQPAPGVTARVLAGELFGAEGPVRPVTPWSYVHVTLEPDARIEQPVPPGWTASIYVFEGVGMTGTRELRKGDFAVFADDGDTIALANASRKPMQALLLCARPTGEPMARYGPFVMNTTAEIERAFEDFRAGRFGQIAPVAG